jgi:hypothetical protein
LNELKKVFFFYTTQRTYRLRLFFIAALLFHLTDHIVIWVLGFAVCWLTSRVIFGSCLSWYSFHNAKDAARKRISFLDRYALREVPILDKLPEEMRRHFHIPKAMYTDVLRRSFGLELEPVALRVFVVTPVKPSGIAELKAYSSFTATSLVFLPDEPDLGDPISRFQLYHELGHVSVEGSFCVAKPLQWMVFLITELFVYTAMLPMSTGTVIAIGVFCLANLFEQCFVRKHMEVQADAFALRFLGSTDDVKCVLTDHEEIFRTIRKRLGFVDQLIEWLRIVKIKRALKLYESNQKEKIDMSPRDFPIVFPNVLFTVFTIWAASRTLLMPAYVIYVMLGVAVFLQCVIAYISIERTVEYERRIEAYIRDRRKRLEFV